MINEVILTLKNRFPATWEFLFLVVLFSSTGSSLFSSSLNNMPPPNPKSLSFVSSAVSVGSIHQTLQNHQEHCPQSPNLKGTDDSKFPFLDPSIANILLQCEKKKENKKMEKDDEGVTRKCNPCQRVSLEMDQKSNKLLLCFDSSIVKQGCTTTSDNTNTTLTPVNISIKDLVDLAQACDDLVFGVGSMTLTDNNNLWSPPIQGLIQLAASHVDNGDDPCYSGSSSSGTTGQSQEVQHRNDAQITAATLLALNGLESAIRHSLGHVTGRAPLLRTMIAQLAADTSGDTTTTTIPSPLDASSNPKGNIPERNESLPPSQREILAAILQRLLLPNPVGLNLRNIIWHGFIGNALPRPWLALVVVLTTILLQDGSHTTTITTPITQENSNRVDHHTNNGDISLLPIEIFSFRSADTTDISSLQYLLHKIDSIPERIPSSKGPPFPQIKAWLPRSHYCLWDLALEWVHEGIRPTCTIALLTILLEQGLRLDWCRLNQRSQDSFARPGAFFVTLDGHGQRHVHDLLLHPYVTTNTTTTTTAVVSSSSPSSKAMSKNMSLSNPPPPPGNDPQQEDQPNQLIFHLGGSTVALLTDLFASSCGGPNIRATVSHGLWDSILDREIMGDVGGGGDDGTFMAVHRPSESVALWDMVRVLLVAMEMSSARQGVVDGGDSGVVNRYHYRPVFSFTATTRQYVYQAREALVQLLTLQATPGYLEFSRHAKREFGNSNENEVICELVSTTLLQGVPKIHMKGLLEILGEKEHGDEWTADDVFAEHKTNQQLASGGGAARSLLKDVAEATAAHIGVLTTALSDLSNDKKYEEEGGHAADTGNQHTSRRQRRRLLRVVHASVMAFQVYTFAALMAVVSMEQELLVPSSNDGQVAVSADEESLSRKVLLKAVERSRMVVSTVDTFLHTNPDRALKAVREYVKGKAIKAVAARAAQSS